MNRLMTKSEVCEYLGISVRTLYRIVERRELSCIRVAGGFRCYEADVEAYLDRQRVEARPVGATTATAPMRGRPTKPLIPCEYVPGMKVV